MNSKEFILKINSVEKSIDLSKINFKGFNSWPFIRLSVLHKWLSTIKPNNQDFLRQSFYEKLKNFILSIFIYKKNPIKKTNIDIIYFSRSDWFKHKIDGKLFIKWSDSFNYFFNKKYKIKNIEIGEKFFLDQRLIKLDDITYLHFKLILQLIKYKLKKFSRNLIYFQKISSLDNEYEVQENIYKVFGFKIEINDKLIKLYELSIFFEKIIKNYNPKIVFLECFYYEYAMAISLACHRQGIKCVDLQHGAPNDYQIMYSRWENIPSKGYELIPDTFWMWGKEPKKIIDKWAKKTERHNTIIGGNLWMHFLKENRKNISGIKNVFSEDKINILVSLHGDEFFPPFLIETIKNLQKGFLWHFRNHPTNPISNNLRKKLLEFENVEVEYSSKWMLYNILEYTDINLTAYSTVAFEAQCFNVPTIFTHVNGLNGYKDLINKNGLYYADNKIKLKKQILNIIKNPINIKSEYISNYTNLHKISLKKLMECK